MFLSNITGRSITIYTYYQTNKGNKRKQSLAKYIKVSGFILSSSLTNVKDSNLLENKSL